MSIETGAALPQIVRAKLLLVCKSLTDEERGFLGDFYILDRFDGTFVAHNFRSAAAAEECLGLLAASTKYAVIAPVLQQ